MNMGSNRLAMCGATTILATLQDTAHVIEAEVSPLALPLGCDYCAEVESTT